LYSHSIEAIFLGYSDKSKAYRLMNTSNQKILISRDVLFNENIHIDQNIDIQEDKKE